MALGPGKYHDEAVGLMFIEEARAVVLIVVGGKRNSGMEIVVDNPENLPAVAELLRTVASQIDADCAQATN